MNGAQAVYCATKLLTKLLQRDFPQTPAPPAGAAASTATETAAARPKKEKSLPYQWGDGSRTAERNVDSVLRHLYSDYCVGRIDLWKVKKLIYTPHAQPQPTGRSENTPRPPQGFTRGQLMQMHASSAGAFPPAPAPHASRWTVRARASSRAATRPPRRRERR